MTRKPWGLVLTVWICISSLAWAQAPANTVPPFTPGVTPSSKVGSLTVAGLKFEQLQPFLTSQISRIYQNFDLNVTMGDLRSLYDFLSRQLEAARIDEAKSAVLVQVVDRAVVPEKKSAPKRLLLTAVAAVLALLVACLYVLFREALNRLRHDPVEAARFTQLNQYLRSPLR